MTRKILYVSGTRADYGLMRRTLRAVEESPDLSLEILVCGMHLDPAAGETVTELSADGFTIVGRVATHEYPRTGGGMARGVGRMIVEFTAIMEDRRPDVVLLLGDRGEMLAAAIAALHLNIPIAHIHGGERSGTIDEPVRHAISKLAHIHFVATTASRDRLIAMGERADNIFVVGAPGLDGLTSGLSADRCELARQAGLNPALPMALFLYHPVSQESEDAGLIADAILNALRQRAVQVVALMPNTDGGSEAVAAQVELRRVDPLVRVFTHLRRDAFVDWMAAADFMIGNSSAGIIEAASFGTPVVNVGPRQTLRERGANVIDADNDPQDLVRAIDLALATPRCAGENIYGDGRTAPRIASLLGTIELAGLLWKCNAY